MRDIIVQTTENVTLVGASKASKGLLRLSLGFAPYLIAADGGAELALNCGITPKKVIGDFDSVDRAVLSQIPENDRIHLQDQETTDFEKCLVGIKAPLILGVGFLGRRLDHQLAAFNSLVRHSYSQCILIGKHELIFHLAGKLDLELEIGSRLSLFPFARVRGVSEGLQWPIKPLVFAPDAKVGTSNRVVSSKVRLEFFDPGMLVILPRIALGAVIAAFEAQ